eukprot:m.60368 g.60368  ORF g.60368 m.60368 type:complete len:185 (-) comp7025_c0_seq1:146-700(-)
MESHPHAKLQRTESGAHAGDHSPEHFDPTHHPEVFTETHSEEDERHNPHESGPSDHPDSAPHPHHKEHMVVALGDVSTKFRVFLGDDVTLKTSFPEGTKVVWKHNNELMPNATTSPLLLPTVTAAVLGDYECSLADGSASYRCSLGAYAISRVRVLFVQVLLHTESMRCRIYAALAVSSLTAGS